MYTAIVLPNKPLVFLVVAIMVFIYYNSMANSNMEYYLYKIIVIPVVPVDK